MSDINQPKINLGKISERLGFHVAADFLTKLGFQPVAHEKRSMLYAESDFPAICDALIKHLESVKNA